MSTVEETSTQRERRIVYAVVAGALALLLVVALIFYRAGEANQEAQDKANQLIAALEEAGVPAPSQEQIVGVLGDDGGALCNDPASALRKSILFGHLTNGAAGPGIRPVIVDSRVFRGQLLVIQIYCPDELPEFQQMVEELKTAGVAGG
jgi:Tfp pilus assembly protein FimT